MERCFRGLPPDIIPQSENLLPFEYESTGIETHLVDLKDPGLGSRRVFSFVRPGNLHDWIKEKNTLCDRLKGVGCRSPRPGREGAGGPLVASLRRRWPRPHARWPAREGGAAGMRLGGDGGR